MTESDERYIEMVEMMAAIREYVREGRRDAFEFSARHYPKFKDVPGNVIQRMIEEEYSKRETIINERFCTLCNIHQTRGKGN